MNVADILALMGDRHVNFTAQMYLDDEPPIAGGREIWGFPKGSARPTPSVVHDTPTGSLHFIADLTLPYGRVMHDYLAH